MAGIVSYVLINEFQTGIYMHLFYRHFLWWARFGGYFSLENIENHQEKHTYFLSACYLCSLLLLVSSWHHLGTGNSSYTGKFICINWKNLQWLQKLVIENTPPSSRFIPNFVYSWSGDHWFLWSLMNKFVSILQLWSFWRGEKGKKWKKEEDFKWTDVFLSKISCCMSQSVQWSISISCNFYILLWFFHYESR